MAFSINSHAGGGFKGIGIEEREEKCNTYTVKKSSKIPRTILKKSRDVKCFRCQGLGHYAYECPNKKVMILRDREYISECEVEKGKESEEDEEEVEKTPEGELLMIRPSIVYLMRFPFYNL